MNILVIKQTSLGDVLHASGHIRAIKNQYPDSHLVLLTATTSADIYRHNPRVDELILVDWYGFKQNWYRKPLWAVNKMKNALTRVRKRKFELAIDLQGLGRSVLFLYGARAERKVVKGRWWGLQSYRNKQLHAIKEMDNVLSVAGIAVGDTSMEFPAGEYAAAVIDDLLLEINPRSKPVLLISPYSRWPAKDWPIDNYMQVGNAVSDIYQVVFTGSPERKQDIDQALTSARCEESVSVAGELSLPEFAELTGRASLMLTGDSFPMHVASAKKTPVIALFGPTNEAKVGPLGDRPENRGRVIRAPDCHVCYRKHCPHYCLSRLNPAEVIRAIHEFVRH